MFWCTMFSLIQQCFISARIVWECHTVKISVMFFLRFQMNVIYLGFIPRSILNFFVICTAWCDYSEGVWQAWFIKSVLCLKLYIFLGMYGFRELLLFPFKGNWLSLYCYISYHRFYLKTVTITKTKQIMTRVQQTAETSCVSIHLRQWAVSNIILVSFVEL